MLTTLVELVLWHQVLSSGISPTCSCGNITAVQLEAVQPSSCLLHHMLPKFQSATVMYSMQMVHAISVVMYLMQMLHAISAHEQTQYMAHIVEGKGPYVYTASTHRLHCQTDRWTSLERICLNLDQRVHAQSAWTCRLGTWLVNSEISPGCKLVPKMRPCEV